MILYFGNKLSRWGGSLSVIETLSELLAKDFEIRSYSTKRNQFFRMADMVFQLFRWRHKCRLVLVDSYSTLAFWYTIVVAVLCRLLRISYIPIVHGGNFPIRLKTNPILSRIAFKSAASIVSPSLYLKEEFYKYGYNCLHIPNSIPIESFAYRRRKNLRPRLLWVRSFQKVYNPMMAVYVLRKIVDHFPEGRLCMVGGAKDNSFENVKLKVVELGLQNNIEFTGSISRKNWIEMSSEYDVFINTTNADNMPVSLVEALALGIPIVTTNPGGIPFLLEHRLDALICKCNDVDEMTSYVLELLGNGELASRLSENGRKKAERYSWVSIQTAWYDLLGGYEVRKK